MLSWWRGGCRAAGNRSGPCACAGGGGVWPIGWLLPCAVAVTRPMAGQPLGGNRRSNRFPLIENSCWARPRNPAASTGIPHRRNRDRRRGGKRAKNQIPPRAATQHTDRRARACALDALYTCKTSKYVWCARNGLCTYCVF